MSGTLQATVLKDGASSTNNITLDASGNATIGNNLTVTGTLAGNPTTTGTVVMGSSFLRNRIINGAMQIDQRNAGASQTITAAAALAYTVDRWYAYCTGANVTGQQVQGATANQYRYRFTGAASVTAIGFAQRIEAINSADLAGTTATLSVDIANSLLTTVTWTAYYANTTDTFGTLASPTVTSIATGTFTVTSTVTRYNAQISIPAAATTGLQILFTVGAQISGTWTVGNVQLEPGSAATPFERRLIGQELVLCQRYYEKSYNNSVAPATAITAGLGELFVNAIGGGGTITTVNYAVSKRANPTVTSYDNAGTSGKNSYYTTGWINGGTATVNNTLEKGFNVTLGGTGTLAYMNADWTALAEL